MAHAIRIGDRLLSSGMFDEKTLAQALQRQRDTGGRLGSVLFDMGVISRYTLANLLNRHSGLPLLRIGEEMAINQNTVVSFPRREAMQYGIVPINQLAGKFIVGAMDPPSPKVVKEIEVMVRKPVLVRIIPENLFHQLRRDYLMISTNYFETHVDPSKVDERSFLEGHQARVPRDLILFEVVGIALAFKRQKKGSDAKRLGDMLVEDGIVTQAELNSVIEKRKGVALGEAVLDENLIDTRTLSLYLSRHYGCATIDPYSSFKIAPEILKLILPGTARKLLVLPLAIYEGNLLLALADPNNENTLNIAKHESGMEIRPVVSPRSNLRWLIGRFYPQRAAKPV